MSPLFRTSTITIAAAVLASCTQEITPPQPFSPSFEHSPVVTGASRYTLERTSSGWRGKIAYAFANTSDRRVSLLNCRGDYGVRLQKRVGDAWVDAWSSVVRGCLSPPLELAPGETLQDEIDIFAGRPGSNVYPQFSVSPIEGEYRLVIGSAYWNYDHDGPPWGDLLPIELRASDVFELRTSN